MKEKLTGTLPDLQKRALEATREGNKRAAQENVEDAQTMKRTRLGGAPSRSYASSMPTAFGPSADVGGEYGSQWSNIELDELADGVKGEIARYESHFMTPREVCDGQRVLENAVFLLFLSSCLVCTSDLVIVKVFKLHKAVPSLRKIC